MIFWIEMHGTGYFWDQMEDFVAIWISPNPLKRSFLPDNGESPITNGCKSFLCHQRKGFGNFIWYLNALSVIFGTKWVVSGPLRKSGNPQKLSFLIDRVESLTEKA